MLVDY